MSSRARGISKFPNFEDSVKFDGEIDVTGEATFSGDNTFSGTNTFTGQLPNFTGMIASFATATPPTGWLVANGAAVSRTTFAALFAAVGTTWGAGDGSTTFNLPDLREAAPVGIGTRGAGAAADVYTLGEFKDDQMQQITGEIAFQSGSATLHVVNGANSVGAFGGSTNGTRHASTTESSVTLQSRATFDSANSPGARTGTTTRGKRVGVQYCIKF